MSRLVEWTDELSVGIEEIDEQHKMLADLVNRMHMAIEQRHARDLVRDALGDLASYTRIHFLVEESLMRLFRYPDYEPHKEQHDKLIAQLEELQQGLDTGRTSVNFELMHFLKVWLTKHILEGDKAYSSHFLDAGANARLHKRSWVAKLWGSQHR